MSLCRWVVSLGDCTRRTRALEQQVAVAECAFDFLHYLSGLLLLLLLTMMLIGTRHSRRRCIVRLTWQIAAAILVQVNRRLRTRMACSTKELESRFDRTELTRDVAARVAHDIVWRR